MIIEYFKATKSSHPQRLSLPVVAPYSLPIFLICSPISLTSSVGKGPEPTLVVYALKIPITFFILLGAIPRPEQAPATVVFEEVTNG